MLLPKSTGREHHNNAVTGWKLQDHISHVLCYKKDINQHFRQLFASVNVVMSYDLLSCN